MKKKELLLALKEQIEKNAKLEAELKKEKEVKGKLMDEINASYNAATLAQKQVADIEKRVNELLALIDSQESKDAEEVETAEEIKEQPNSTSQAREPLKTEDGEIDTSAFDEIRLNKEMQYASEAIAEIVVSCATLCNDFAKIGGANCREYINLALGRTEVFKADCLTIASADTSYSVKKECIDRIKMDIEDYFEGLKNSI